MKMNRQMKRLLSRRYQKDSWRKDMKKKGFRGKPGAKLIKRYVWDMLVATRRKKVILAGAGAAVEDSPITNPRKNALRWERRMKQGRYHYA